MRWVPNANAASRRVGAVDHCLEKSSDMWLNMGRPHPVRDPRRIGQRPPNRVKRTRICALETHVRTIMLCV